MHWVPLHMTVGGEEVTWQQQGLSNTPLLLKPSTWFQEEPGHANGAQAYGALPNS